MASENNKQCSNTRKRSQSRTSPEIPHIWSDNSRNNSENESEEIQRENPALIKAVGRNQSKLKNLSQRRVLALTVRLCLRMLALKNIHFYTSIQGKIMVFLQFQ
ncbi:uncharacterized protein LOC117180489 [Belonocnema kinseyi]|uniref:uncharacterized protein LOC117180489 n=1 Tax=Belonocnema kinseyi TaxID=2817044 RepID=UPI00143D12DD|nr:uncharacterized protein LOC117180489 [Belonocnema kinseyi]